MPDRKLHLPQGTEAFYLDEAYTHRKLLRTFEDRCELWGYLPAQTPVYDFHELYRGLHDRSHDALTYRLVDRAGEVLVLRSDITLFLARQMGLVLEEADLPVRLHYGDTILRHEDPYDISRNEFFQVGAELIGPTGLAADAESVLLLFDVLDHWGASDVVIHLGHRALLAGQNERGEVATAVSHRDWARVRRLLSRRFDDTRIDSLIRLYSFIGSAGELEELVAALPAFGTDEQSAVNHVLSLAGELAALGYAERIRIDLSEVGSQSYHSGIVFQAYASDAAAPIATGGRYDGLLAHFGLDAPSIGFSVMLRRLQSRSGPVGHHELPHVERPDGSSFRERVVEARRLRSEGKVVVL